MNVLHFYIKNGTDIFCKNVHRNFIRFIKNINQLKFKIFFFSPLRQPKQGDQEGF